MALNVRTICMPTFTFSFCNGLAYNPETSISKMGILNEFFRKQKDVIRSNDPLLSVALNGVDKDLVERIGKSSIGANSNEAQNSKSTDDFVYKFKIAAKEANETEYWLNLCQFSKSLPDCSELINDLARIQKNYQSNHYYN